VTELILGMCSSNSSADMEAYASVGDVGFELFMFIGLEEISSSKKLPLSDMERVVSLFVVVVVVVVGWRIIDLDAWCTWNATEVDRMLKVMHNFEIDDNIVVDDGKIIEWMNELCLLYDGRF